MKAGVRCILHLTVENTFCKSTKSNEYIYRYIGFGLKINVERDFKNATGQEKLIYIYENRSKVYTTLQWKIYFVKTGEVLVRYCTVYQVYFNNSGRNIGFGLRNLRRDEEDDQADIFNVVQKRPKHRCSPAQVNKAMEGRTRK